MAAAAGSLLLVVGGECGGAGPLGLVLEELERGIRSWDVDPGVCSLDQELKTFVSQHSATFSSLVKGQRSLHHRGDALETLVLLNPSDKSLCDELRNLLLVPAPHKLLVLAGPCLEETGELLLQTGGFSSHHFLQVLEDKEVRDLLDRTQAPAEPPSLTLGCPPFGDWAQLGAVAPGLLGHRLRLNPAVRLPASAGLRELLDYLAGSLEPPSPFDLLEPPSSGDILKLDPPCCYIFPGGLGDAAFFAVSDFTVLVNGGSNPKATFWKLVRHVDRVDAVLVTHAGADSLPGVNSLLRRKVAERQEAAAGPSCENGSRRLASPGLGVVFLHAQEPVLRLLGGQDEAEVARGLLAQLGITPLPLRRSLPAAPTVLLEKLGVGRLDLHVLHPPAATAAPASACVLLVWLPADPTEKVVRALFPGRTPPARLLEGLGRLQHLGFLREPVVTPQDLQAPQRTGSKDSVGSRDSTKREVGVTAKARLGSERPTATRREAPRRTMEGEAGPPRELKKDLKPSSSRTQPRDGRRATVSAPHIKKVGAQMAPKVPAVQPAQNGPRGDPSPGARPGAGVGSEPGLSVVAQELGLELQGPLSVARPCSPAASERPPSLSPLRDPSPAATTPTATTPSLPAEVGSPHSTEVDESLSVSLEQGLPPPLGPAGDAGLSLPLRGPQARRSASPHDVDLCLVSPCEFEHRKVVPAMPASPGSSQDSSAGSQERAPEETPPASVSESLPTLSDSELLPAVPEAVDSEDDTDAIAVPRDPLPAPLKDPPPLLDTPGLCMVDPEVLPPSSARSAANSGRPRKPLGRSSSGPMGSKTIPAAVPKSKGLAGVEQASRVSSTRSEPSAKGGRAPISRKTSVLSTAPKTVPKTLPRGASGPVSSRPVAAACPPGPPVYLDLAYLPGASAGPLGPEFFLRVRAFCYVISGQDQHREQGLRTVLDALLDAKRQWDCDVQVTLIPTFDSAAMRRWYEETHMQHQALGIRVLGSSSMVFTEDEAFPACKLVF